MAAQVGLCLAWSETPDDMFCRVVAQLNAVSAGAVNSMTGHITFMDVGHEMS